jgi:hypothetical protein
MEQLSAVASTNYRTVCEKEGPKTTVNTVQYHKVRKYYEYKLITEPAGLEREKMFVFQKSPKKILNSF